MIVKTLPPVSAVEEWLSAAGDEYTAAVHNGAMGVLGQEGWWLVGVKCKRSVLPRWKFSTPIYVASDWDPEMMGADVVLEVRPISEDEQPERSSAVTNDNPE